MVEFSGIHGKLDRAERVIDELNESIVAYLSEARYEIVGEFDREASEYVWRGNVTKPVPIEIGVLVGDVCHNLRTALDHLVWQLALLTTDTPYRRTQFPIARCEEEFTSKRGENMIRDVSTNNRALIEALQPHNGPHPDAPFGPPALADLLVLSNTDKHRVINTALARQAREIKMEYALTIVRDITSYEVTQEFSGGSIHGAEMVRVAVRGLGPDPKMQMEGQIPVTVGFDDPALSVQDASVIPMLGAILRGVREIIALKWDL